MSTPEATTQGPIKLGLALPHLGADASPDGIRAAAQRAERLGYASLWALERWIRPRSAVDGPLGPRELPDFYGSVYDPLECLSHVAGVTERIELGTSVIDVLLHPPILLARRVATVDRLCGGRLTFGIGQGWMREEFAAAGVPWARRGRGIEEVVGLVRALWGPDPVSFQGRLWSIPPSDVGPKPSRPGGPPIVYGGSSPIAIERAVRCGAGLHPVFLPTWTWETLTEAVGAFRAQAAAAGRGHLPVVLRVNPAVDDAAAGSHRAPFQGSPEQVLGDVERAGELGVDHAFFDLVSGGVATERQPEVIESLAPRGRLG